MAAIGKIRSWGPVLAIVIGLALFAFIAEEMFRSCESQTNERRQQVGKVLDQKVNVQDYQALVDEYQQVLKMTQGRDNLSEEELNQVKDQVWGQLVNNAVIEAEAKKLGLMVTDEEMQNLLREGTNPMLRQTPFVNQQTGLFDVNALTKFLDDYRKNQSNPAVAEQYKSLYDYWRFIEKNLRQQRLMVKYQSLIAGSMLSNPISAKASFEAANQETDILLASIPYTEVNDKDVKIEDADIKAQYDKQKERFRQFAETRDIKFVAYQVIASDADRLELGKQMGEAADKLESGAMPAEVVRKAQSQIPYTGLYVTRNAIPSDIMARVDSMAVGQNTRTFETTSDNTFNVVKLVGKAQMPDSVEYRVIQVAAASAEEGKTRADSIFNAIKGGADFETLAKAYGQDGAKQWLVSAQYERSPMIDADTKAYIETINTLAPGETKNLAFNQGNVIIQVTDRRAMVTKYDVAIIKHTIDFSKQTYSDAYNRFSQYVSENKSVDALERAAKKYDFQVQQRNDLMNSEHNVANLRATRDAMKWIFDAKEGDVSPLYECGNNDYLLVVAVTKIHPEGYRDMESMRDILKDEVMRDKKFEQLQKKLAGAKSIAEAEKLGAKVDTVKQITFSSPVFVQSVGANEPSLSGAVANVEQGKFSSSVVKGNNGAYVFQVIKKSKREGQEYDEKTAERQLSQQAQQSATRRFMQELVSKANVVDNRYIFF